VRIKSSHYIILYNSRIYCVQQSDLLKISQYLFSHETWWLTFWHHHVFVEW